MLILNGKDRRVIAGYQCYVRNKRLTSLWAVSVPPRRLPPHARSLLSKATIPRVSAASTSYKTHQGFPHRTRPLLQVRSDKKEH